MSTVPVKARVYRLSYGPGGIWVWKCEVCRKNRLGCAHHPIHPSGTWRAAMCGAFRHVHVEHPRTAYDGSLLHQMMLGRWRCDISRPSPTQVGGAWDIAGGSRRRHGAQDVLFARQFAFADEILALDEQYLAEKHANPHSTVRFTQ